MGAVLMQNSKPIAYLSKRFSSAELNYSVSEQELCATIYALKTWRHYLEGCAGLTIITDHHPNTFFQGTPVLSRRQARWYETLQRFHFTWKYEPGHTNIADPLSRCSNLLQQVQEHTLAAMTRARNRAAAASEPAPDRHPREAPSATETVPLLIIDKNKFIPTRIVQSSVPGPSSVRDLHATDLPPESPTQTAVPENVSLDSDVNMSNDI
jgi:hypothetical protein